MHVYAGVIGASVGYTLLRICPAFHRKRLTPMKVGDLYVQFALKVGHRLVDDCPTLEPQLVVALEPALLQAHGEQQNRVFVVYVVGDQMLGLHLLVVDEPLQDRARQVRRAVHMKKIVDIELCHVLFEQDQRTRVTVAVVPVCVEEGNVIRPAIGK